MADKKINVLYFINTLGSGGTERQLTETLLNLDENQINPVVVYYRDDNFYLPIIKKKISKVFYLPKSKLDKILFWRMVKFVKNLKKIVEENDIDIIHSWSVGSNFLARIISYLTDRRVIISIRNIKLGGKNGIVDHIFNKFHTSGWYILENIFAKILNYEVITNSPAIKNLYLERVHNFKADNIAVVANGFDIDKISYLSDKTSAELKRINGYGTDKFTIINVGRITEQKNQLCLLKALKKITDEGNENIELIFVGKKYPYAVQVECYIKKNNLEKYTSFINETDRVFFLVKAADLMVLCSLWEGLPNVVIESMAIGTPVVCSEVEGIDFLINDKINGLLFKINDEIDLAEKIKTMMVKTKQEKEAMIQNAKITIRDRFSIQRAVREMTDIYMNVSKFI